MNHASVDIVKLLAELEALVQEIQENDANGTLKVLQTVRKGLFETVVEKSLN